MDSVKEWLVAFWKIIYNPLPHTFSSIAKNAEGKFWGSIAWLVFITIFSHLFNYLLLHGDYPLSAMFLGIVVIPMGVLFYVFWIRTFYKKLFRRRKDYYNELLYVIAAIYVVLIFVSKFLVLIPAIGEVVEWIPYGYFIVLTVIAVKAITKLRLWEAIVTVVLSFLLTAVLVICMILFVFGLLLGWSPLGFV